MAVIPCPNKVDCPGSDFPITNYSAEGGEQVPQYFSIYFPTSWDRFGCLSLCVSEISQNDADLCAIAQEAQCPDPPPLFCSVATTCSCESFGGSEFFYTTPAGTFCADTQEAADALAYAYACDHCSNRTTSTQLVGTDACTCLGVPYSSQITYQGVRPVSWIITDGSLPDGLTLNSSTGLISGTPTVSGTYSFTVRSFNSDGNYATRPLSIAVISITTAVIDPYTLGQAYSFQLQAAGGSGTYAWKINSGALPTGLTMSLSGLITGTPTAVGTNPIVFQVIDTVCEATNKSFFIPQVAVVSSSSTIIRTRRGYGEYQASTGNLYKKVTYEGYAQQIAMAEMTPSFGIPFPPPEFCGGAKFLYSGSSEINVFGNFISSHRRDLYVPCTTSPSPAVRDPFGNVPPIFQLLGYCWAPDPTSCPACPPDPAAWLFKTDYASHSSTDFAINIIAGSVPTTTTPTSFSVVVAAGGTSFPLYLGNYGQPDDIINFPITELNGVDNHYIELYSVVDYTATLSEPFTVADEIAGQLVYTSNGRTSENKPNYLTWVQDYIINIQSRYTAANYTLNCTNLLDGEAYTITYELWDSNGSSVSFQTSFIASGTTHTITGLIPTPAAGRTITLRNVRIAYT